MRARRRLPTGAVGLITEPEQAEEIVASAQADVVLLAREMLRDPYWPLRAAHELGVAVGEGVEWPPQYQPGRPRLSVTRGDTPPVRRHKVE